MKARIRNIQISGNSMDRAGLLDGMVVRVRAADTAQHGDIVVVRQADDGLVVKRYFQTTPVYGFSGGWLVPESSEPWWKPRPMLDGDHVVGVVIDLPKQDVERLADELPLVRASALPSPGPAPRWPEDAQGYQHHRGPLGARLMAIVDDPLGAMAQIAARLAWERRRAR